MTFSSLLKLISCFLIGCPFKNTHPNSNVGHTMPKVDLSKIGNHCLAWGSRLFPALSPSNELGITLLFHFSDEKVEAKR